MSLTWETRKKFTFSKTFVCLAWLRFIMSHLRMYRSYRGLWFWTQTIPQETLLSGPKFDLSTSSGSTELQKHRSGRVMGCTRKWINKMHISILNLIISKIYIFSDRFYYGEGTSMVLFGGKRKHRLVGQLTKKTFLLTKMCVKCDQKLHFLETLYISNKLS